MDDRPVVSCMVLAVEAQKRTSRAWGREKQHPLIEAYADHNAMQCGYCTPGFVVTAKALLDRNPDPDEEAIKSALEGNICRCGTYPAHVWAIQAAANRLKTREA